MGFNDFQSPIVPVVTKMGKAYNLGAWMLTQGFLAWAVAYPIVPKGQERVRIVINADNSHQQIERLVEVVMQWDLDQESGQNLGRHES